MADVKSTTCKIADCGRPIWSSGLCNMHRQRLRNTGTTDPSAPGIGWLKRRIRLEDRFWSKVGPISETGCRYWLAAKVHGGYGCFHISNTKRAQAHAMAWRLTYQGPTRPDDVFRHWLCDTPGCVEPSHIYPSPQARNIQDCIERGRRRYLTGAQHWTARMPWKVPRGPNHYMRKGRSAHD